MRTYGQTQPWSTHDRRRLQSHSSRFVDRKTYHPQIRTVCRAQIASSAEKSSLHQLVCFWKVLPRAQEASSVHKPNGRQITTNIWFPTLTIMKSIISRGGKGVFAKEDIIQTQNITKYCGKIIAECDDDKTRNEVFQIHSREFIGLNLNRSG